MIKYSKQILGQKRPLDLTSAEDTQPSKRILIEIDPQTNLASSSSSTNNNNNAESAESRMLLDRATITVANPITIAQILKYTGLTGKKVEEKLQIVAGMFLPFHF